VPLFQSFFAVCGGSSVDTLISSRVSPGGAPLHLQIRFSRFKTGTTKKADLLILRKSAKGQISPVSNQQST
jgi:hypothetical protein